jgi:NTP pyrophosphatase (non-canonical NTP hydrolase)
MLNNLAKDITAHMTKQGFWEDTDVRVKLLLVHSEVSEAAEALRTEVTHDFVNGLADAIIRVLDICGRLGIDIDENVQIALKESEKRGWKHGKKF